MLQIIRYKYFNLEGRQLKNWQANVLLIVLIISTTGCSNRDWRTASRAPAGIAADPYVTKEAIIEVYAADAFSWRGWFAVHTWIAVKGVNETHYTVHEVVGWRVRSGLPALYSYQTKTPDRYWYGAEPQKLISITGAKAEKLIPKVNEVVKSYPWADEYTILPGPNSNTFTAWVGKQIPELQLSLPFSAIGSSYAY